MNTTALGLSAREIVRRVQRGEIRAQEVVEASLAEIQAKDATLGAFLFVDREGALQVAAEIDRRVAAGEAVGALAGVPVAIKDNIHIAGIPTTCASRMLQPYRPPYSAHVIERLKAADAILIGKTNLDEFAMGSSCENSALRTTKNPWNLECVPGGSSGGSAVAVAGGLTPLALGSDTGGSIRMPASFCGIVGMKPTYGRVSRYGLVAFGSSLDQIGPFAKTVSDAILLLEVIAGHDQRDATSSRTSSFACPPIPEDLTSIRLGLPKEYFETEGLDPAVKALVLAAVDRMAQAGAKVCEVTLPTLPYAIPTYYVIATAEASSNLGRYDGVHYGYRAKGTRTIFDLFSQSRDEGLGPEVKRRIMLGTYVLSAGYYDAYYLRALKVRTRIAEDFARAFTEVDVLLSPTAPTPAFRLGERIEDPLAMYLSDIYTIAVNLAGLPAISVPCGLTPAGLPVGIQMIAPRFYDESLLALAAAYERLRGPFPSPPSFAGA